MLTEEILLLHTNILTFYYSLIYEQKHVGYHREDDCDLFPGVFATVESVGVWLLHCHVNDHIVGGMKHITVYGMFHLF